MLSINLEKWWEELGREFDRIVDESALTSAMGHFAERLDFRFFALAFRQSLPGTGLDPQFISNYPSQWVEHYKQRGYNKVDPIHRQAARTRSLIIWSDNLFSRASSFWEEAKQAGLSAGVSQSNWSAGGVYSILSLARSGMPLDRQAATELEPFVLLLTDMVMLRAQELLTRSQQRIQRASLTDREIEILRWSADGKKAFELANMLGISESTVNFHLHNARRKLGFSTKFEAAAYAAKQGLLD